MKQAMRHTEGDKLERWTTNYVNNPKLCPGVMKHILLRLIYKVIRGYKIDHPASYDVNEYVANIDHTIEHEDFIKNLRNENRKKRKERFELTKRGSFDTKCFVFDSTFVRWKRFIEGLVILEMQTLTVTLNRLNTSLTGGSVRNLTVDFTDPEYLKQFRDSKLTTMTDRVVKLMGISDGIWKDLIRQHVNHGTPPASDSSYPLRKAYWNLR
ncbi:hypothetical protein SPFM15_00052 [Salmonella phage SPFM15]|nr:hypothetical protein SPFM5_00047 [Salmonella phage SPFM5]VFR13676.1 hypothetical protein SPFM15_00052 [Salmonella phage SPFM15]